MSLAYELLYIVASTLCLVLVQVVFSAVQQRRSKHSCDDGKQRSVRSYYLHMMHSMIARSYYLHLMRSILAASGHWAKRVCKSILLRADLADSLDQANDITNRSQDALLQEVSCLVSNNHIQEAIKLLRAARAGKKGGGEQKSQRPGPACFRVTMQAMAMSRAPRKLFNQLIEELYAADLPIDALTECCCVRYLCSSTGEEIDALEMYGSMLRMGIAPDILTIECLVTACLRAQRADTAKDLILSLDSVGLKPSAALYASLITAFGMMGDVDRGISAFTQMRESMGHNREAMRLGFVAAVSCCAQNQELGQALALCADGLKLGIQWGTNLVLPLLVAAVQSNEVNLARQFAAQARDAGIAGHGSAIAKACRLLVEQSDCKTTAIQALEIITSSATTNGHQGISSKEIESATKKLAPDTLAVFYSAAMHTL